MSDYGWDDYDYDDYDDYGDYGDDGYSDSGSYGDDGGDDAYDGDEGGGPGEDYGDDGGSPEEGYYDPIEEGNFGVGVIEPSEDGLSERENYYEGRDSPARETTGSRDERLLASSDDDDDYTDDEVVVPQPTRFFLDDDHDDRDRERGWGDIPGSVRGDGWDTGSQVWDVNENVQAGRSARADNGARARGERRDSTWRADSHYPQLVQRDHPANPVIASPSLHELGADLDQLSIQCQRLVEMMDDLVRSRAVERASPNGTAQRVEKLSAPLADRDPAERVAPSLAQGRTSRAMTDSDGDKDGQRHMPTERPESDASQHHAQGHKRSNLVDDARGHDGRHEPVESGEDYPESVHSHNELVGKEQGPSGSLDDHEHDTVSDTAVTAEASTEDVETECSDSSDANEAGASDTDDCCLGSLDSGVSVITSENGEDKPTNCDAAAVDHALGEVDGHSDSSEKSKRPEENPKKHGKHKAQERKPPSPADAIKLGSTALFSDDDDSASDEFIVLPPRSQHSLSSSYGVQSFTSDDVPLCDTDSLVTNSSPFEFSDTGSENDLSSPSSKVDVRTGVYAAETPRPRRRLSLTSSSSDSLSSPQSFHAGPTVHPFSPTIETPTEHTPAKNSRFPRLLITHAPVASSVNTTRPTKVGAISPSIESPSEAKESIDSFFADPNYLLDSSNKLRLWQSLCIEFGLVSLPGLESSMHSAMGLSAAPLPTSLTQARRLLKAHAHVNLVEYMAARTDRTRYAEGADASGRLADLLYPSARSMMRAARRDGKFLRLSHARKEWLDPPLRSFGFRARRASAPV